MILQFSDKAPSAWIIVNMIPDHIYMYMRIACTLTFALSTLAWLLWPLPLLLMQ